MKTVRLKQMEQFIIESEFVTINELCDRFKVHPNTVRADIKELVEKGVVEKRYGGVANVTHNLPTSFFERQRKNTLSKERIGQTAMTLLNENDVIFVDSGTTALMLFKNIAELPKHLTIITNNLDVLTWTSRSTEYTVFVLPGKVDRQLNAIASLETIDSLKLYNIQKAFIGSRGISLKGELSSTLNIDAKIKNTAIRVSNTVILMADSKKINHSEIFSFANLGDIDYWVCDEITEEIRALAQKNNTKLLEINK
jgi:DeoR family myo-inositol catabolism operon transcriptional repressor